MESLKRDLPSCKISASTVILDIEGTTTSISFVKDILFPYIRSNLEKYLNENWGSEKLQEHIKALRIQAQKDEEDKVEGVIPIPEECEGDALKLAITSNIKWQMDQDRKTKSLKDLQGLIMEAGYTSGDIKGHVYDDVEGSLKSWSEQNKSIYIYSSGSIHAQKLLFGHSEKGDLLPLIKGHFDTSVGMKGDASSYKEILKQISISSSEVAFLTDVPTEAKAAKEAGILAVLVSREGNALLSDQDKTEFQVISSFEDIEFENNCKKMKICPENPVTISNKEIENCSVSIEDHETPDPNIQNCIDSGKSCDDKKMCNGLSNSDELMDIDDTSENPSNCDTKQETSTEIKKEASTEIKKEESNKIGKVEITDGVKEESIQSVKEESLEIKEESAENMKDNFTEVETRKLNETIKETLTENIPEESNKIKEVSIENKVEDSIDTMKEKSVETKTHEATHISEEESMEMNEESTEEKNRELGENNGKEPNESIKQYLSESIEKELNIRKKEELTVSMKEMSAELKKEESVQSVDEKSMQVKEESTEIIKEKLAEIKTEEPIKNAQEEALEVKNEELKNEEVSTKIVEEESTEIGKTESTGSIKEDSSRSIKEGSLEINEMEVTNEGKREESTGIAKEESTESVPSESIEKETTERKEEVTNEGKREESTGSVKEESTESMPSESIEKETTERKEEVTNEGKREELTGSVKEESTESMPSESIKKETTERKEEVAMDTNDELINSEGTVTCSDIINNGENVAVSGSNNICESSKDENSDGLSTLNVENHIQNLSENDDKNISSTNSKSDLPSNEETMTSKNKDNLDSHVDPSFDLNDEKTHNENEDCKKNISNDTSDTCGKEQSEKTVSMLELQNVDCTATNGLEKTNKIVLEDSQMVNGGSKPTNGFSTHDSIKDNGCTEEVSLESSKCDKSEITALESVVEA